VRERFFKKRGRGHCQREDETALTQREIEGLFGERAF